MTVGSNIMAEFQNRRFIVAPSYLLDDFDEHTIILSDIEFWSNHYDDLINWLDSNGGTIQGMGVTLPDDITLTAFCLRWS